MQSEIALHLLSFYSNELEIVRILHENMDIPNRVND